MKRKGIILVLLLCLVLSPSISLADKQDVKVFVRGEFLREDSILRDGRTFVPLRLVSEKLDFDVDYRDRDKTILIKKDGREILLSIGSKRVYVDGKEELLDSQVFLKDNKTFVPLRFISESLYENVEWDKKNRVAVVGYYGEDRDKKDSYLYYNKLNKYSLSLPIAWKEEVIIEEKPDRLYIYDRASLERFKEDGDTCGPSIEIRVGDHPVIADFPYEGDILLSYDRGQYIEAIFDRDFQYYKETEKSYRELQEEGGEVFKSFEKLEDEDRFVEDDISNFKEERLVLESIVSKYVPKNIFDMKELKGYRYPMTDNRLLYLPRLDENKSPSIKIESEFDMDGNLTRYHFKNYSYEIKERLKKIGQDEALKLANEFAKDYIGKDVRLIKMPDLYPSLYEEGLVESYGDLDGRYAVLIDLENGFVEFFSRR